MLRIYIINSMKGSIYSRIPVDPFKEPYSRCWKSQGWGALCPSVGREACIELKHQEVWDLQGIDDLGFRVLRFRALGLQGFRV